MLMKSKVKFISCLQILVLLFSFFMVTPVFAASLNLTGDIGTHDPTLAKDGSTWWSPHTGPGLTMKYSTDGLEWHDGVPLFSSELSWWRTYAPKMGTNDVWAPDLKYFNGRYWMYYSVSGFGTNNSAIGLQSCTSINAGDWRDDGLVISSKSGATTYNAIDPNLTIDSAGVPWLVFGSFFDGLHIVKLDTSTMKPTGTIYSIAYRDKGIEGASVVYNNGYYYLFASIDKCCLGVNSTYKMVYGRSKSITGPYVDVNGIEMKSGGGTILEGSGSRYAGVGGQYIYKNGSSWLIAYHGYDKNDNGNPKLLIRNLYFDEYNWPTYNLANYSGYYKIVNRANGKAIDNMGVTTTGSNVSQYSSTQSYNQQWEFISVGNGYYKLACRTGGLRLDSLNGTTDGSLLGQWSDSVSYNEQWQIINDDQGYVKIINRANGKALDTGNSTTDGTAIQMWSNNGSYNQQWSLVSVN